MWCDAAYPECSGISCVIPTTIPCRISHGCEIGQLKHSRPNWDRDQCPSFQPLGKKVALREHPTNLQEVPSERLELVVLACHIFNDLIVLDEIQRKRCRPFSEQVQSASLISLLDKSAARSSERLHCTLTIHPSSINPVKPSSTSYDQCRTIALLLPC